MNDAGAFELVLVLTVMAVLFIFGLVAVIIFYRTWRKEKKK